MRAGFTDSRENVLATLYRMGATLCAYSNGEKWADRCDCKYKLAERWPTGGERGNGCPELRSLYIVIDALTDDEWARLVRRAGGAPLVGLLDGESLGARFQTAVAAIGQARAALADAHDALVADE